MGTENIESCSQRDSAERKGYVRAHRSFNRIWKERDSAQPELLEEILDKGNLNRAFKRVKANKGAPGIDGITVEEIGAYLRENQKELIERIKRGKYTPGPVRRVEIPKPDGGIRKLGIPTVKDRIFQQAITQRLTPVYEPLFSENSYGYRPGRSAKDAIQKVKEYAEQGYIHAVALDLSKYFDTLNHEILLNILRRNVRDERVIQWIKRYLKSGVMENGVVMETEEGSPQGGNLSPLLANIYLNEFDQEYQKRGVVFVRYADDIVLLAERFLAEFIARERLPAKRFASETIASMLAHRWPGNVRELQNRVSQGAVMSSGRLVQPADMGLASSGLEESVVWQTLDEIRGDAEREALQRALVLSRHNHSQAATQLGISRATLYRLLEKHNLSSGETPSDLKDGPPSTIS